jgi:TolB-like protein
MTSPSLWTRLKDAHLFRVLVIYAAASWVLLQIVGLFIETMDLPRWTMPWTLILLVVGLIVVLVTTWVQSHPSMPAREAADEVPGDWEVDVGEIKESISAGRLPHLNWARAILGGVVAFLLLFGFAGLYVVIKDGGGSLDSPPPQLGDAASATAVEAGLNIEPRSIAVLPFADLSPAADQGWFADGLTEEILNSLTRLPELTVTARTSSFHFKGQNLPVQEIAARLGVAHIVEGSVRRDRDQLRITAQLIRAADGFHLWSDIYDRSLEDVFAVQEDVAENVARALDIVLDAEKREQMFSSGTRSVEAYEAFLRGRVIFEAAHNEVEGMSLWDANVLFEKAIAADPEYYLPHYFHRDALIHFVREGIEGAYLGGRQKPGLTPEDAVRLYMADTEQAIKYAPSAPQRILYEIEKVQLSNDWRRLPGLIQRLESLDLSNGQYSTEGAWVHNVFLLTGRVDFSLRLAEAQLKRNPLDPFVWSEVISALQLMGRYDEAAARLEEARDSGVKHAEAMARLPEKPLAFEAMLLAVLGRRDEASQLIAGMDVDTQDGEYVILAHMLLGDQEAADRLAAEIDARLLGSLRIQDVLYYSNWRWSFHIEATPNFKARLLEAGLTEAEIAARHHPAVRAATVP